MLEPAGKGATVRDEMAQRFTPPEYLPGATEFSEERELLSPRGIVELLKTQRWLADELEKATTLDKNWGRRKEPGTWALAYLAFVSSGQVDIEPWWKQTTSELWRACGFTDRPAYPTAYERFVELEQVSESFFQAASTLIQRARRHEPRIGAHVHVDGTEAETHAALVHDCHPGEGCTFTGKRRRPARRPLREATVTVRKERQRDAEQPPTDADTPLLGEAEELKHEPDGRLRVRIGEHWYRTLDTTAGIRAYTGPRGARRFWHGFYNEKAIDHFTGAPLAVGVYSASRNEHDCYPELYQRLASAIDGNPETIIADKGFSVERVFHWNTRLGVATVIPWRKANGAEKRRDCETHDRHGIPRCKHCGGPSKFVRFSASQGSRLWFRCTQQATAACQRDQSIACSRDYRFLIPLWRTDPLYHELQQSHSSYERVHRHWRERYKVAGDSLANRPKRRGLPWQQLRAQAALLLEWLCLAWREGWLGSARRNRHDPERRFQEAGFRAASSLRGSRARKLLNLPYGPPAAALGIGNALAPSERTIILPTELDPPDAPDPPGRSSLAGGGPGLGPPPTDENELPF